MRAAHQAIGLSTRYEHARANLVKSLPLLLGARGQYRETGGWSGRLALYREGQAKNTGGAYKLNWDIGIRFDDLALQHTIPKPMHVRVSGTTRARDRCMYKHQRVGTACIAAEDCGFDNPAQVILSCLNEFERAPKTEGVELLCSEQLDALTQTIEAKTRENYNMALSTQQAYHQSSQ